MDDIPGSRLVVGRQGIYDPQGRAVAYELLFRGDRAGSDGSAMTAEVVFGAVMLGLDRFSGGLPLYCNADRSILRSEMLQALPADRIVVEVLETVELDDEVIAACAQLRAAGYTLAADDFVWRPGAERLLELVSIVKIDLLATTPGELRELVRRVRRPGRTLLAEKVEDAAHLPALRALGFTLFQGYALERPQVVAGATLPAGALSGLESITGLLRGECDFDELEALLRRDPGLALQFVQLASIGRVGEAARRVGTLRDALVLAGLDRARNWVVLLLARRITAADPHRFLDVLAQARACEVLAAGVDGAGDGIGFVAGMLSALPLVLPIPPTELRAALSLSPELDDAAFGGRSRIGRVVSDVADFQQRRARRRRRSGLTDSELEAAFGEGFGWAGESLTALRSA